VNEAVIIFNEAISYFVRGGKGWRAGLGILGGMAGRTGSGNRVGSCDRLKLIQMPYSCSPR
jgi:hypothetical protein